MTSGSQFSSPVKKDLGTFDGRDCEIEGQQNRGSTQKDMEALIWVLLVKLL
jgi:hypothetical protein